jgi:bloom syndrome protein
MSLCIGMGINKPDVRYVIHHSLPKSLINYYQESGRAGRDGQMSDCIIFFCYSDKALASKMITGSEERSHSKNAGDNKKREMDNLLKCVDFCLNETECRRVQLLAYFGETFPRDACNKTCDNCKSDASIEQTEDVTVFAENILKLLQELVSKGYTNLTVNKIIKVYIDVLLSFIDSERVCCTASYTAEVRTKRPSNSRI